MFLHDVYECRNDRHKSDCICAVCQVTRRKKERDEILAVVDNETAAMDSNTSDQHDMEVSLHIQIFSLHIHCTVHVLCFSVMACGSSIVCSVH